jgi:hypothetical protein
MVHQNGALSITKIGMFLDLESGNVLILLNAKRFVPTWDRSSGMPGQADPQAEV